MLVIDPALLIALAAVISSLSAFIWSLRRKPWGGKVALTTAA